MARKVGRPAPAGCRAAALGHTAREHTAYGILDFAASASALLRIGVGIVASSPYVGLGVASGVGCGGVRRWRRCPAAAAVAAAAAAVAAATAAASTAVELAAGRGVGGGNGGGWLARCHQTADSLLWYSLRYGRASKGAAGGGGRRGGAPVCGAPEQERPASGSGGSSQQPARRHRRKKT